MRMASCGVKCALVALLLAFTIESTRAETRYVSLACTNPVPPYTNWVTAATTIQDAINSAAAGDVVVVTNGYYDTGFMLMPPGVTNRIAVTAAVSVVSVNGPTNTFIVGGTNTRCAYLASGARLAGFTLQGAQFEYVPFEGVAGAGAYCVGDAVISNCVIQNCIAGGNGGGVFGGTVYDSILRGNSTGGCHGGGISDGAAVRCVIVQNFAQGGGGTHASALQNCLVVSNSSFLGAAGGLYGSFVHCTVVANASSSEVGGLRDCAVSNSIVYFNTGGGDLYPDNYYICSFSYSCTLPDPGGMGNIADDPRFIDRTAGDFRLAPDSPCIDAGSGAATNDLDGRPRPLDGNGDAVVQVDMGCYELAPTGLVHRVALGSTNPLRPYLTWDRAAATIDDAIAEAAPGDTIMLSNGTYHLGTTVIVPPERTFCSLHGASVTILDGGGSNRCVWLGSNAVLEGLTVQHGSATGLAGGVYAETGSRIRNCVISSNSAVGTPGTPGGDFPGGSGGEALGGGAYLLPNCVVEDCTIEWNLASGSYGGDTEIGTAGHGGPARGGGLYGTGGVVVARCLVQGNTASGGSGGSASHGQGGNGGDASGGGLHLPGGQVQECRLSENKATGGGGGWGFMDAYGYGGTARGGAIFGSEGAQTRNSLLVLNAALGGASAPGFNGTGRGGGVCGENGDVIRGCTIVSNRVWDAESFSGYGYGGGVHFSGEGTNLNSIIWSNQAPDGPDVHGGGTSMYCCAGILLGGEGNIFADPLFVDPAAGNYHLLTNSPCVDTGTNLTSAGITNDLMGVARPQDGNNDGVSEFDMGCCEGGNPGTDSDADSLNDYQETSLYGTAPLNPDTDGDAQTDGGEVLAGTDPLDDLSFLGVARIASVYGTNCYNMLLTNDAPPYEVFTQTMCDIEGHLVNWPSVAPRHYRLLNTDDLGAGFTNILGANIPATPTLNVYTDRTVVTGPRFYRIELEP